MVSGFRNTNLKYFMFVFENGQPDTDLLTAERLQSVCSLEQQYMTSAMTDETKDVIMSLPRFTLCYLGKDPEQCHIDHTVVVFLKDLFKTCSSYYYNNALLKFIRRSERNVSYIDDSSDNAHPEMPMNCQHNAEFLYNVMFHFTPNGYYSNISNHSTTVLTSLLTLVPRHALIGLGDQMDYYTNFIEGQTLEDGDVRITAMQAPWHDSLRYDLFNKYLYADIEIYFALALGLILLIMLLYTRSSMLVLATTLNVIFSFVLAYAIYYFILRMPFFPFINILAGLVLIAVGADDVFIFYDTWLQVFERDPTITFQKALARTFSHATLSIFVTSLTTASAFFANSVSSITCIQCFGIFSGIAILVNFVFMVTWTPAVVVAIAKVSQRMREACCSGSPGVDRCCNSFTATMRTASSAVFSRWLPKVISKAWFVWITLLLLLGVAASVVIFYKPGLKLPESQDIQLFPDSNILEKWKNEFHEHFPFLIKQDEQTTWLVDLYIAFGFKAKDEGNRFDPDDEGDIVLQDPDFDFYSGETQEFLLHFCESLKNQTFVRESYKNLTCSLRQYGLLFQYYCIDPSYSSNAKSLGCCTKYEVPYDYDQLNKCLPLMLMMDRNDTTTALQRGYSETDSEGLIIGTPLFDLEGNITAFTMYMMTNLEESMLYDVSNNEYETIKNFFDRELQSAPKGLQSGFFSALWTFTFYDLQHAIAYGTFYSIGLSLGVALVVMLLTSLNALITLYAIVTISLAISCTVGSIVLMGWHLNIIESITISLAVGLSIDFTIHYGVAYRLSKAYDGKERVDESFSCVGSAVAMAALTTFAAGSAMMPSHTVAYTKLGTFLMLVMAFSWLYATFFFQSVCRIIGPRGTFCQIPGMARWGRCCRRNPDTGQGGGGGGPSVRIMTDDNPNYDDDDDDRLLTL